MKAPRHPSKFHGIKKRRSAKKITQNKGRESRLSNTGIRNRTHRKLVIRSHENESADERRKRGNAKRAQGISISPNQNFDLFANLMFDKMANIDQPVRVAAVQPTVRDAYRKFAADLKEYTHGKIPREITQLVRSSEWCDSLSQTQPLEWSPHAYYEITKLFVSNLKERDLSEFHEKILLPIFLHHSSFSQSESKKSLHQSRYKALQKALFKPSAFFHGFLVPLCQTANMNSRQALIIGSLLQKYSFPKEIAMKVIRMITTLQYSPALAMVLRCLIEKKFQFEGDFIMEVGNYFLKFLSAEEKLTVLWHQLLLSFVKIYRSKIDKNITIQLKKLADKQFHESISPEIHRALR